MRAGFRYPASPPHRVKTFCLFWEKRCDKPGKRYVKQKQKGEQRIFITGQAEKGQALLEFALSLMVLLLLTFGMIDFSRAAYTTSTLQAAAQAGARAGIIDVNTVEQVVQQKLVGLDLQKTHITTAVLSNGHLEVQITYEFEFITPLIASLTPHGQLILHASASMLIQ